VKFAPTLADQVVRQSYDRHTSSEAVAIFRQVAEARCFVLDKTMSAYLADLGNEPFQAPASWKLIQALDATRRLARLPHRITWIEYDGEARHERAVSEYHITTENHPRQGWLLRQHPVIETAFTAGFFVSDSIMGQAKFFPLGFAWGTDDDAPLPWKPFELKIKPLQLVDDSLTIDAPTPSEALSGVAGFECNQVAFVNHYSEARTRAFLDRISYIDKAMKRSSRDHQICSRPRRKCDNNDRKHQQRQ
jgi:hypothetical protein